MSDSILVTGGLGFIGKHFVARSLEYGDYVVNVDSVNYAADRVVLSEFNERPNYNHIRADIAELEYLPECDVIVNFAAESHVDNAITSSAKFCHTNILGTHRLLDLAKQKQANDRPRFVQISTDEVYGDIAKGTHTEDDILNPSNPYSATKASADLLIQSYGRTYGVTYNIVRPANNYGSHQYPEKLIPKTCNRLKRGLPAILHGDGSYVRSWLHVEDTASAIRTIIDKGEPNTTYNVAGPLELQNKEVVLKVARLLQIPKDKAWVVTEDRYGQDVRYGMDDSRILGLGWRPTRDFDAELESIVNTESFRRFL